MAMKVLAPLLALAAGLAPVAADAHCCCEGHHKSHARRESWSAGRPVHWRSAAAVMDRPCDNYPASAARARASGVTWLEIRVGEDGWTRDARVSRSSGRADLDRAALACVNDWRFYGADRYDWREVRVNWRWVWSG